MARLYHAGAEIDAGIAPLTQNFSPDGQAQNGTVTRDTSVFRSGAASYKCDSAAGNVAVIIAGLQSPSFVDGTTYFLRAYFRASAAPSTAALILGIGTVTASDVFCRFRTDGAVELFAANAAQGSASVTTITDSVWHRVELKAVASATGVWSAAELQLDGVSVATWSGSQSRGLAGILWGYGVTGTAPGANKTLNVDDIAYNDSTGASNNSYPGAGAVVVLSPVSDNAKGTGWTNDAAATTNLFNAVKNTPPQGIADTTGSTGLHQLRNATSNANVSYDANMTSYTTAGVGTSDTVNALYEIVATAAPVTTSAKAGTFGIVSNPTVANVALGATGTSGAFWAGATAGTYGAGWKWSTGAIQNTPTVTNGTQPVARITQVTSSTRIAMICAMFIYVEYTPASPSRGPAHRAPISAVVTPSPGAVYL